MEMIHSRRQLEEIELSNSKEKDLRNAFEDFSENEVVTFDIDNEMINSPMSISGSLYDEFTFDIVSSYTKPHYEGIFASALVIDKETKDRLKCHVSPNHIYLETKESDIGFQTFRDYVLFLEWSLSVSLDINE